MIPQDIFVSILEKAGLWLSVYPSGYGNTLNYSFFFFFLQKPRDCTEGLKLSLIVQESSHVPRPVLFALAFTPCGWIRLETKHL